MGEHIRDEPDSAVEEKAGNSEPEFRSHEDCKVLTGLTLNHLPRDRCIGRSKRYVKGSFLWTSESTDHQLYFLQRGQVAVMLSDEAGCEVIVRLIDPGQPFGELCFCSQRYQPRGNCAQATTDSEVLRVGFDDFMQYLQRNTEALRAFTFTFCKRLEDAERRIEILSHRGADARLGRLLLQLASAGGRMSQTRQGRIKLAVGHDELSRMAAMTRPHVSVTMGKLRDRGLVHYDRGTQLTVDVPRLAKYLAGQNTKPA